MSSFKPSGFSISTASIRRHIATLMLTLAVMILGYFALISLQVDLLPSITYPRVGVEVEAPGIAPEVAIDTITRPMEQALASTEGAELVYSQTREGRVRVDLFFRPGGNLDRALDDATAAFNRIRSRLPDVVREPRIFKFDPSQLPVYEFALTSSSLKNAELRVFADEELGRELSAVAGVAVVDVSGGVKEEVQVNVDLQRLQAQGVGLNRVLNALSRRNLDVSGGRIEGQNEEPLTRTIGRFQTATEIQNLSFEVSANNPDGAAGRGTTSALSALTRRIYLRDFAEVVDGTENQRLFVFLNRQPAVKVSVQKQSDANTVSVVEGVRQRIEELRQTQLIPADVKLVETLDESRFIKSSLQSVVEAGVSGAVLAAIAVLVFLGSLRQTFIIVLTIPLCTLAAAIVMKFCGFSLNIFSLGGLAISIGQAVDTSVVILENINKKVTDLLNHATEQGKTLSAGQVIESVEESSREVESAMVASTGTNLVSVLPFILIGGFVSLLFNELVLTICFAVIASLMVAVTVVPMLSSQLLAIPWSSRLTQTWVLSQFNQRFTGLTQVYHQTLVKVLRHRLLALGLVIVLLGSASLGMSSQIPQEILPRINTGQATLNGQFPPGTPLATSQKVMEMVDKILMAEPETEYVFTTVGGSIFGRNTTTNPLRSSSTITLKPGTDVSAYVTRTTQKLNQLNLAGIRLRLSPGQVRGLILSNSPVPRAEIDVLLQGNDPRALQQAGRQVLAALDEKAKLATFRPDGDPRQPEVQIRPDWERAEALGLSAQDIGETVQTAIEGSIPTQIQRGNRLVDVRVQLDQDQIQRPSQLSQIPLFVDRNQPVRLRDVARIEEGQSPGDIQRINQRDVFIIIGSLNKGASLSGALAEVDRVLAETDLPSGVRVLPSSIAETNQQLQTALKALGALAAFLVFVVMAVQYNSLLDPLVIMFTVPLAIAGGLFGLYVTWLPQWFQWSQNPGIGLGATAVVGFVLLIGIVVNNGIIMLEQANQLRQEQGCDRQTAILQAAPQRLRPILMTMVTTVLGLFPLALGLGEGAEFLQPLGIVVFVGLSLATFLTLFVIPCFYIVLHDWLRLERVLQPVPVLVKVWPASKASKHR